MTSPASRGASRPGAAAFTLVAAATMAGAVAWTWPLAPLLATHTVRLHVEPVADPARREAQAGWNLILANDQKLSLWGAVDGARTLLRGDLGSVMQQGQCWPMPDSTALGEHMLELGAMAAPWWAATREPVAAYNLALLSMLVVGATGMFAFLARHAPAAAIGVASTPVAAAGALAFAFALPRLVDMPVHPAVVGTHWIPWVLWAFDGVLAGAGAAGLAAFAFALLMASMVGSYPLLGVALLGGAYGAARAWQESRRRGARVVAGRVARVALASLPAAVAVVAVLSRYGPLAAEWRLPANEDAKFLAGLADFLPGGVLSAGFVAWSGLVALAVSALRGRFAAGPARADGGDAADEAVGVAAALAFATVVVLVLVVRVPLGDGAAWSLYDALASRVPLLDAVRAPGKAALAACLGLQALGALGWAMALQRAGAVARGVVALLLVLAVAIEVRPPSFVAAALGGGARVDVVEVAPPAPAIRAVTTAFAGRDDDAPVLDRPPGRMVQAAQALMLAAWHGHPTSACYNSLVPPTMRATYALGERAGTAAGVQELAAAGFGYVLERRSGAALQPDAVADPARLLVLDGDVAVWALPAAGDVHHDVGLLAVEVVGGATRRRSFAPEPPHEIDVEVTNRGEATWALPHPVRPLLADVTFATASGEVALRTAARGVLPLALAPGETVTVPLTIPQAPPPGAWTVTARFDDAPQATVRDGFRWQ